MLLAGYLVGLPVAHLAVAAELLTAVPSAKITAGSA